MTVRELVTTLGFKYDKAAFDQFDATVNKAKKTADGFTKAFQTAAIVAGVTKVAGAVKGLGAEILGAGGALEMTTASFTTLFQSADKANQIIKETQTLADKSPYEATDFQATIKTMAGFGMEFEKLLPIASQLGDIAQGDAQKLQSLGLVMGQVSSIGKLQGGDLLQLINAGYNPLKDISEMTGKSVAELRKEMEKGQISYQMVEDAMKRATSEGGMFYRMMDRMSETLPGMKSTFMDYINGIKRAIGTNLLPIAKDLLRELNRIVGDNREAAIRLLTAGFTKLGLAIGKGLVYLNAFVQRQGGLEGIAAKIKAIGEKVIPIVKFLAPMIAGFLALNQAMQWVEKLKNGLALIKNMKLMMGPMTPVFLALAAAALLIYRNWDKLAPVFAKYVPVVKKLMDALGTIWDALAPVVEKLANVLGQAFDGLAPALITVLDKLQPLLMMLADLVAKAAEIVFGKDEDKTAKEKGTASVSVIATTDAAQQRNKRIIQAQGAMDSANPFMRLRENQELANNPAELAAVEEYLVGKLVERSRDVWRGGSANPQEQANYLRSRMAGASKHAMQYLFKSTANDPMGQYIPKYAQGTPFVPETGLALLHKGESVIPPGGWAAMGNAMGSRGRGSTLHVNSTVQLSVPAGTPDYQVRVVEEAAKKAVQDQWGKMIRFAHAEFSPVEAGA